MTATKQSEKVRVLFTLFPFSCWPLLFRLAFIGFSESRTRKETSGTLRKEVLPAISYPLVFKAAFV